MRNTFTFSLLFFSCTFLTAQEKGGCGTITPADYQHFTSELERSTNFVPSSRAGIRNVGVTYHVVVKADGTGGVNLKTVFETHCQLNEGFIEPQIYFYIYSIDTIYDDELWAMSDGQGGTADWLSDGASL